ncbi:D-alanyl-D-alanine carboxypeptidase [Actinomadura decatromicini]|uniref:D-alanyl-D-alanine carboxypeptidase n=1 Tax=Actinomadura decatromicini TaxID=2604572 RepID=A0A5D3FZZ1_9ACTN|nr:D-alanyl-D-alanine carboxypeptidase [Actinomadura decatromicini]
MAAPPVAAPPAPPAPPTPSTPPPPQPATAPERERKGGRRGLVVLVAALVLVVGVVAGQLVRPVPDPTVKQLIASSHAFPGQAPALPWPTVGQAVVHVEGLGTMGTSGGATSIPTASVAKVMTAYVYLREHPLKQGQPGPVLTVSPQAAAQIPARKKRGESLLGVTANQRLTQRKALEALLVISANDIAHELARWDSGNEQAFVAKMNETAKSLGMTGTRYTDPSGYDSGTVSTAADQVKLLRAAMSIPAFTEIVNNRAYVADDGTPPREGGNFLLGQYGVVGGKTGYTDAAGGNFVFAARKSVGGVNVLLVGAVMGQHSPTAAGAVSAAERLVFAAEAALVPATVAPKGARVARVDDGLGGTTPLRAAAPVTVVGWPGLTVPIAVRGNPPHEARAGKKVGAVKAGAATVPLQLGQKLEKPSVVKRLIRFN